MKEMPKEVEKRSEPPDESIVATATNGDGPSNRLWGYVVEWM